MPRQKGNVRAGQALRLARERRGLTLLDLQLDEVITMANYSKIERGLSTPSKDKLDDILVALGATFNESQEIVKAFGYLPAYPLPTAPEIDAMRARCQPILDALPLPAYLVDLITRLAAWNDLFARLLGDHAHTLAHLKGVPLLKAQFASRVRLQHFMDNLDPVLLDDASVIRERLAPHRDEQWYSDFIEELCAEPVFKHYWDASAALTPAMPAPVAFATRILHPVRFSLPGVDGARLQFYSNPENLQEDSRFQMIYLIPADLFTMRQMERWLTA